MFITDRQICASICAYGTQLEIEKQSVAIAIERYRLGLSDFLTVIDAQRQLLAEAQGNAGRASIEVYRRFGGD